MKNCDFTIHISVHYNILKSEYEGGTIIMKKKIVSMLLCVSMLAAMIVGCGSKEESTDAAAEEEKVIRVGCEATTPGWIQMDDAGNLSGYDYDVWMEIGERLGYEIDYQVMEWDGMWTMLDDGRIDSVGEQISVTDERKEKYHFADPYAYNYYCLLAAADNEKLQSMEDLESGMTICCETNTSDEIILAAVNEQYGIELEPMYYDGMSVQDVALGRCDTWPRAETSCITTVAEVDNLKILGRTNIIEENAHPFVKTERGEMLCELVNGALNEMREDGTLAELAMKWFELDITVKPE